MVASRFMIAGLVGTFAVAAAFAMPAAGTPDAARPVARRGAGQIFFTPAAADPKLAALIARTGIGGAPFRFTPADSRGSRRIATIALPAAPVRAGEVNLHNQPAMPTVGVAPIAYSLGAPAPKRVTVTDLKVDIGSAPTIRRIVDIGGTMASGRKSKLKATGALVRDDSRPAVGPISTIDVGGSYSLSRNLDVTAGVRYKSQDRDRLAPLSDNQQRDSQAVYVGTAFRF